MSDKHDGKLPDDRRYTSAHIWLKKENDECLLGITDYAQAQLGQIVYVDLPEAGKRFAANAEFGTIESVKAVSPLLMPVAGVIDSANPAVASEPGLINNDCYGKGWLVKITPDDWEATRRLLDADQYRQSLKS